MKKYLILLFAVLFSNQTDIDLKEFQSGKIKQLSGNLYSYYVPRKEVDIRLEKIENSEKVGIISKDNYSNYYIIDTDEIWLSIYSEKDRKLIGYSRKYVDLWDDQIRKLFDRYSFIKTSSEIIVDNTVYQFDLIKCLDGRIGKWDMSGRYYYEISYISGNQRTKIFSNGDEKHFINSGLSVYIDKTITSDSEVVKESDLYVLQFDNEIFGWMFATGKEVYLNAFGGDFTNSWIFVPKDTSGNLYKNHTYDLKFTQIGQYLEYEDNELDIIMVEDAYGLQSCGACTGYNYIPKILRFTKVCESEDCYVEIDSDLNIKITEDFIKSNPPYVYAIAFIIDDQKSMRTAYELFKENLVIISEKCDRYYKSINDYISYDFQYNVYYSEGGSYQKKLSEPIDVVNLEEYWESFDSESWSKHSEAYEYLLECTGLDEEESGYFFYHIFYRTGLYPDPRLIEEYLESKYPAYPYPADF